MEICSESEAEMIPEGIRETAKAAIYELLPVKSRNRYELVYDLFQKWSNDKNVHTVNEEVILAYLMEKSNILKPSSLWSNYSMLKSTLNIKNNIDISRYPKVNAFLKRKSIGYKLKKSKVLNKEEIDKFLSEGEDKIYLMTKVI
uniref:Uncharacterized protein LOC114344851 n=1 Tax=Diabrotica virgifera virgifera TaxID=50390 RepID=A0A6P7H181_DIAVI